MLMSAPPPADTSDAGTGSIAQKKMSKPKKRNRLEGYASMEEALASWDRCVFVVKERNKFCNQRRATDSMFCGNHRPVGEAVSSARRVSDAMHAGVPADAIRRVPCPLDPNHTVYEHELTHHLKVLEMCLPYSSAGSDCALCVCRYAQ